MDDLGQIEESSRYGVVVIDLVQQCVGFNDSVPHTLLCLREGQDEVIGLTLAGMPKPCHVLVPETDEDISNNSVFAEAEV